MQTCVWYDVHRCMVRCTQVYVCGGGGGHTILHLNIGNRPALSSFAPIGAGGQPLYMLTSHASP